MRKLKQSEVKEYRIAMLKDQGGKCAFCGETCVRPSLDHAHRFPFKDKIRGVICNWCNIAIGKLENSRVRTGTSWDVFHKSFREVGGYITGFHKGGSGYREADWHPSKRKSEVTDFKRLKAHEQKDLRISLGGDPPLPANEAKRVGLFKKLRD